MTATAISINKPVQLNSFAWINLGLLAICAALVFYYVLSSNSIAATNFQISSIRDQMSQATDSQTDLTIKAAQLENINSVTAFAVNHQMVISKDASYVFENGNVALVR